MLELLLSPEAWLSLVTLTALEIVLGLDNVVFIVILTGRLPAAEQLRARRLGMAFALLTRILLLLSLQWMMGLSEPLFTAFAVTFSGRDLILLVGGLFLVVKATVEIYDKLEVKTQQPSSRRRAMQKLGFLIFQIMLLDIVFSLDSVITAVGMARHVEVMVAAMVIAMLVMVLCAKPVGDFVEGHPSIKILALSFLILIGVMLISEALHQHVSKAIIYVAMAFSLVVEMINIRIRRKNRAPVVLHGKGDRVSE